MERLSSTTRTLMFCSGSGLFMGGLLSIGQCESEGGAEVGAVAAGGEGAAEFLGGEGAAVEAEAVAVFAGGETVGEDADEVFARDADAVVGDGDDDVAVVGGGADRNEFVDTAGFV